MFMKALSSLEPIDVPKRYTAIIRKEHDDEYHLGSLLKKVLPEINIVATDEPATGALRDAYRATEFLRAGEGVFIMDCDIWIHSDEYFSVIKQTLNDELDLDGGLLLFKPDSDHFSFAALDENSMVTRTAEKQAISKFAIGGGYFVGAVEIFDRAARAVFQQPLTEDRKEYYVSFLYNEIVARGGKVRGCLGEFTSFGTPEELAQYAASKA